MSIILLNRNIEYKIEIIVKEIINEIEYIVKDKNETLKFLILISLFVIPFFIISNNSISNIKYNYYKILKETNKDYCKNIPYNYKIIKNSSKPLFVVLDTNDIPLKDKIIFENVIDKDKNFFYYPCK